MNKSEYRALVQEGKGLVLQGAQGRLRLGEIAQENWPKRDTGGRPPEAETAPPGAVSLEEYAAEIDIDFNTLRTYRDVTLDWGGRDKAPKASWSVLRELAQDKKVDDPHAAFKEIKAKYGKVTIITVRTYLEKKTAGVRSTSPVADKAAQVRNLLREPEVAAAAMQGDVGLAATVAAAAMADEDVAEAVLKDVPAGRTIRRIQHRQITTANAAADANSDASMRRRNEEVWRQKHFHGALNHINAARYQIGQAMEELKLLGTLQSKEIAEAKEDILRLFQAYEWLESAINDGDRSFEEHLAEILSGGEGGAADVG